MVDIINEPAGSFWKDKKGNIFVALRIEINDTAVLMCVDGDRVGSTLLVNRQGSSMQGAPIVEMIDPLWRVKDQDLTDYEPPY